MYPPYDADRSKAEVHAALILGQQPASGLSATLGNRRFAALLGGAAARNPSLPLDVQRAPMVNGEFVDPTPSEGEILEASGNPLTSPTFKPSARFDLVEGNAESAYKHGEYRQLIKGSFRQRGEAQRYILKGGAMSEDEWIEDAKKQTGSRYGYRLRSQGTFKTDKGELDKVEGRHYQSTDRPQAIAEDDEMDLHFRGLLVDTGDKNRTIAERHWHVYGKRDADESEDE